MPTAMPFRGLRYVPAAGSELDLLIAPPYDVIPEETRTRLAARHANNIVHLDLPRGHAGGDPHGQSRARLQEWIRDGILARDQTRAFYACEQRYRSPSGEARIRRGFFARLRLEGLDSGIVIPHERTLDAPRIDRQALLAATRTHLSAVFLLHPDPGGVVARLLAASTGAASGRTARGDDGTIHRVVPIDDVHDTAVLQERLEGCWALIADGHHRYESALAYRDARRASGHNDAEHVLAYLCSLEDPGLSILPIHRVVRSLTRFEPARFRRSLDGLFTLTEMPRAADLVSALQRDSGRPGRFGFVFRQSPAFWLVEWVEGAGLAHPGIASLPEPLRLLDVILLHRLVLEDRLGISAEEQSRQSHLEYVTGENDVLARLDAGDANLGVLMNPTRMEQVIEVCRGTLRLPQKSTYFHPKVPSGLVLDPLDD